MGSQMIYTNIQNGLVVLISRYALNRFTSSYSTFIKISFQIGVEQAAIDHVRNTYAPPNDPVFELVPPEFGQYASILYQSMGSPSINSDNVWNIYRELLHRFEHLDDAVNFLEECQVYLNILDDQVDLDDEVAVPPTGIALYGGPDDQDADGNYYMGGVNNGRGLGK